MKAPLALCALVTISFAGSHPARGEPFLHASFEGKRAALPARYGPPLPTNLIVNPSLARLEEHFHVIGQAPKHLAHRACRDGAPERAWIVDAMRRAAAADRWPADPLRLHLALAGCARPEGSASLCRFALDAAANETAGPLRDFLIWRAVSCAGPEAAPFFAGRDVPDEAVIAFRRRHPALEADDRLEAAVRTLARGDDLRALERAVQVFGRADDPRVTRTLLALHTEARDPDRRRILGIGLSGKSDPRAREVFEAEYRSDCEARKVARERAQAVEPTAAARLRLGYALELPLRCDTAPRHLTHEPPAPPERPLPRQRPPNELRIESIEFALKSLGHETKVFRFAPDDAGQYGEHAPLLRRMADQVSPRLDNVVFDEAWPAVDAVDLDRGPHRARAFLNGEAFDVGVGDRDGAPDQREAEAIADELGAAFSVPHFVDAYTDGERIRFEMRGLGRVLDVEALVGAANALLRARGSDWRFLVLDPFDFVEVVAGPRRVLLDAIAAGVLRPGRPFAAARKDPEFEPARRRD